MQAIAIGLANHNPFAYMFLFLLFEPPIVYIICIVIEKIKKHLTK
jgi:hypothetical protein